MRKFFPVLSMFLSLVSAVCAQELISSAKNGTLTVVHINQRLKTAFDAYAPDAPAAAIDLYKLSYRSRDEKNQPVVLTGLLALPKNGAPKGLIVFAHGTISNRNSSPSRLTANIKNTEAELATLAFATGGYAVAMPDYLGLGDHQGAHPYPLGASNSLSAVDIIEPARRLAQRQNVNVGARLFITGYSEGGAVAMWTVRDLERKSGAVYDVFAAAPVSGSYDLSDITRKWLLVSPTTQEELILRLYLLAHMGNYFHKSMGLKLTDYFKPAMALTISQAFKSGTLSDENVIKRLALTAVLMRSKSSLGNVITPRFKKVLETLDTSDPVIREMQKNDTYDWKPRTKMLLVSLANDKVVAPANSDKAFQTMKRRGVGSDMLRQFVLRDANLTHVSAVAPTLAKVRKFFDNGFEN